jgi:hypothetical protein
LRQDIHHRRRPRQNLGPPPEITMSNTEYKVLRVDADSTTDELSAKLNEASQGGWKLVSSYHLHHLNSIDFVFGLDK